jgi:site-specific recombinase
MGVNVDILSSILSQKVSQASDKQSEFERVHWFTQVMKWIQRPHSTEEKSEKRETIYTVRLKYLLLQLKNNPEWKKNFVSTLSLLLMKISSPSQLTKAGLPEASSFVQDFIHRLQEKILPKPQLSEDLSTLMYEIFPHEEESLYIDFIDVEILKEVFELFKEEKALEQKLKADILAACYVLGHEIQSHSLAIQNDLNFLTADPQNSPEFILEGILRQHQSLKNPKLENSVFGGLAAIEAHMNELHLAMQEHGVKIELVYLFQIQKRKINRLFILMQFLISEVSSVMNFRYFISHLILETQHQKSLKSFFSENLTLITDRIVQTNSHIGEHYVTFTWTEFRRMFQSALGGGAITAWTVFAKHSIGYLKLAGFAKGFLDGLNYATSFLGIQLAGFTLATKQPSATAPFIAKALKKSTTESRRSIVALLRTQFIAVLGNLSAVFPICVLISLGMMYADVNYMSGKEAISTIHSSDVLGSAPIFALFTGGLLFVASLIAGWFENWILVNRIDKRIKYNDRLQKYFGAKRMLRFGEFLYEKSNPLAANISLGFLLGLIPQVMKFLNIPLEAKHVTLSTGAFASALPYAIEAGISALDIVHASLGILLIGFLNISVSFSLAFLLASISSHVKFAAFWRLLKWGVRLIFTKPWLLIVPEKEKETAR